MSKFFRRVGTRALAETSEYEFQVRPIEELFQRFLNAAPAQVTLKLLLNRALFRKTYCSNPVLVGHASAAELEAIDGRTNPASARDLLHAWSLVADSDPDGRGTRMQAQGWRVDLGNIWVTSALAGVDLQARVIRTKFGHAYRLELKEGMKLASCLRGHLACALHTWGLTDVGP